MVYFFLDHQRQWRNIEITETDPQSYENIKVTAEYISGKIIFKEQPRRTGYHRKKPEMDSYIRP